MKLIISKKTTLELTTEKAQALRDEMKFACNRVSVFPIMEEVLAVMEA